MSGLPRRRLTQLRLATSVLLSTVFLTAAFLGVVSVVTGSVSAFEQRLPIYVLVAAFAFLAVILVLEDPEESGAPILASTVVIGVSALIGVSLAGEGLLYTLEKPDQVASSQVIFYFVAAALICTGLGYWAVHHWREFTGHSMGR
jgi:drug/metabolite transporter (DMT)-like permease